MEATTAALIERGALGILALISILATIALWKALQASWTDKTSMMKAQIESNNAQTEAIRALNAAIADIRSRLDIIDKLRELIS